MILRILAFIIAWSNTDILKIVFVCILKHLQVKVYNG